MAPKKRARKTAKKTARKTTKKTTAKPPKELLDAGDRVEYSLTTHVVSGSLEMWPKFGVNTAKRPDESDDDVSERIVRYVEDRLNAKVEEILGE